MRYDCIERFIIDGTPCAVKAARTVWTGGKPGDNFQRVTYPYQQCYPLRENRKIIFIITDGKADSVENTEKAIEHGKHLGFEFYGIGIGNPHLMTILPNSSKVIAKLEELTPTMFEILQNAILK
jgi:hypothetical protein